MTNVKHDQDGAGFDTETMKLLLLSILDEYGSMTIDTERFQNMGSHRSWAVELAPAEEGRMSVSVTWH